MNPLMLLPYGKKVEFEKWLKSTKKISAADVSSQGEAEQLVSEFLYPPKIKIKGEENVESLKPIKSVVKKLSSEEIFELKQVSLARVKELVWGVARKNNQVLYHVDFLDKNYALMQSVKFNEKKTSEDFFAYCVLRKDWTQQVS